MQQNSDNITTLFPDSLNLEVMRSIAPDVPFSDRSIDFLSALSSQLMKQPEVRRFPDVATFAFFCRKAHLHKLRQEYLREGEIRLGRGLLFHIAPSNVPVNFAYSMVAGVLSGNTNMVRVPSKDFEQVTLITNTLHKVLTEMPDIAQRIALIKYERGGSATETLSAICDARIIWGGDETIANIRHSALPPRSFDVTFADRYSFCAIDANNYLKTGNAAAIAEGFYNDTYLFDQNACSAPHLVVWVGAEKSVEEAKAKFWEALYDYTEKVYELADVLAVDKLTNFYKQSVGMNISHEPTRDNLIWRVDLLDTPTGIEDFRCAAGYFSEFTCGDLSAIVPIIKNRYQTIAYFGFPKDDLQAFITRNRPCGIDRIVPIGKTTDFSLTWDGYNLIETLSRQISIL